MDANLLAGMGGGAGGGGGGGGGAKKAVHVKWAGKTIALGTFPQGEAEDKCARAKALTRAWRSTMRPKPTREWVMLELERLGVRVVSGRLGRGKDDDEGDEGSEEGGGKKIPQAAGGNNNMMGGNMGGMGNNMGMNNMMGMMGMGNMGGNNMGNSMGMNSGDNPNSSSHRPLVGGGAAAAFNAAREDHYRQMEENNKNEGGGGGNQGSSMNPMAGLAGNLSSGMGSGMGMGMGGMPGMSGAGGGSGGFGLSVNPNQHYEMLKLHHMNLLNEIQETTLMMNLYQQQQLQQQQQTGGVGMGMGMMNQTSSGGMGGMLNLQGGDGNPNTMNDLNSKVDRRNSASSNVSDKPAAGKGNEEKTDDEKASWLKKLKEDIAAREREAAELEASLDPKRKSQGSDDDEPDNKKVRTEV